MTPRLWTGAAPLLLASTSRTRRLLLESAGIPVETEAPGVDERAVEAAAQGEGLDPSGLAARLAAEKALSVSRRYPGRLVLGADQVLDLDGRVLHKAPDRAAAIDKLLDLAGRRHALRSAVALAQDGAVIEAFVESAVLAMRPLDGPMIERYLDTAGPDALSSVGAYQIESLGVHLFEEVQGDHATILGLPLIPLLARLRARGRLAF
jgi:septum formation protein